MEAIEKQFYIGKQLKGNVTNEIDRSICKQLIYQEYRKMSENFSKKTQKLGSVLRGTFH